METIEFTPQGVCARKIEIQVEDGIIANVSFIGGCDGNLKAISKLLQGMEVSRVIELLEGNICGPRSTSCADQLAQALKSSL